MLGFHRARFGDRKAHGYDYSDQTKVLLIHNYVGWMPYERYKDSLVPISGGEVSKVYFLSHKWRGRVSDPNGEIDAWIRRTKAHEVHDFEKSLKGDWKHPHVAIWVDFICTPQVNPDSYEISLHLAGLHNLDALSMRVLFVKFFGGQSEAVYEHSAWCTLEQILFGDYSPARVLDRNKVPKLARTITKGSDFEIIYSVLHLCLKMNADELFLALSGRKATESEIALMKSLLK